MIGVFERAAAPDGDEPRIALLGKRSRLCHRRRSALDSALGRDAGAVVARFDDLDAAGQVEVRGGRREGALDPGDAAHRVREREDRRARARQAGPERAGLAGPRRSTAGSCGYTLARYGSWSRSTVSSRSRSYRPVASPATPSADRARGWRPRRRAGRCPAGRLAHLLGREPQLRDEQHRPEVARGIEADGLDALVDQAGHGEPAEQRGGGVVRVALDLGGEREEVRIPDRVRRAARSPRRGRRPSPRPMTRGHATAGCGCA